GTLAVFRVPLQALRGVRGVALRSLDQREKRPIRPPTPQARLAGPAGRRSTPRRPAGTARGRTDTSAETQRAASRRGFSRICPGTSDTRPRTPAPSLTSPQVVLAEGCLPDVSLRLTSGNSRHSDGGFVPEIVGEPHALHDLLRDLRPRPEREVRRARGVEDYLAGLPVRRAEAPPSHQPDPP